MSAVDTDLELVSLVTQFQRHSSCDSFENSAINFAMRGLLNSSVLLDSKARKSLKLILKFKEYESISNGIPSLCQCALYSTTQFGVFLLDIV